MASCNYVGFVRQTCFWLSRNRAGVLGATGNRKKLEIFCLVVFCLHWQWIANCTCCCRTPTQHEHRNGRCACGPCRNVCVNACIHTCMYVWMYVCTYVRTYVRTYVCMHVCMYIYIYMCVCTRQLYLYTCFPSQNEIVHNKLKLLHGNFEITPPIRQGFLMPTRTA